MPVLRCEVGKLVTLDDQPFLINGKVYGGHQIQVKIEYYKQDTNGEISTLKMDSVRDLISYVEIEFIDTAHEHVSSETIKKQKA